MFPHPDPELEAEINLGRSLYTLAVRCRQAESYPESFFAALPAVGSTFVLGQCLNYF
jgi:hypothetical protein